jgi:hypothetical protein
LAIVLAICFWVWAAFIAAAAGFVGAVLNTGCGDDDGCEDGFPSFLEPWTWGEYYVYPEVTFVALAGLAAASALAVLAFLGRQLLGAVALVVSLVLLSYPFFAGLTSSGRALFWFGALFGIAAVTAIRPRQPAVS